MARKPLKKRSSTVGGATYVPSVPIDNVRMVDGVECITVSIEFTVGSEAHYRCRIAAFWGPWRDSRSEAMYDLYHNIRLYMHGRPYVRERDYEVRPLNL